MAFATGMQARLPLGPLARGFLTTPQASLHAADWPVAPRPASTPGSRPTPGAALPGTLASPRAGLPPAGCHELVARLHRRFLLSVTSAPELLDAHSAGNPVGKPTTVPLNLDGQVTACRDGRLRAAISQLIALANGHSCKSIMVEDLNFTDIRWAGRETLGHGRRGKSFRRTIAGIPTGRFRDVLVGMATNAGLWVVAVDPAYTSKWARQHWLAPLRRTSPATATVHHAAAVVIGRRGLGHNARRRPGDF